jgi:hypothetical protein
MLKYLAPALLGVSLICPAAVADPAMGGKLSLMAGPSNVWGANLEATYRPVGLTWNAEAIQTNGWPPRYWSSWLTWRAQEMPGGHSLGLLAGYSQSVNGYPGPGPTSPVPWDPALALLGVSYAWTDSSFWLRTSPHLLWIPTTGQVSPPQLIPSLLTGPPLLEIGWRPLEHLEVGLRLAVTIVRVSWVF